MRIMDDRAEVTKLQKGHGEWNEDMLDVRYSLSCFNNYRKVTFLCTSFIYENYASQEPVA